MDRLFPDKIDNEYDGKSVAKWILYPFCCMYFVRSIIHILLANIGFFKIEQLPRECMSTVIILFALWGISQLIMSIMCTVVLWKYQKAIPLMYLLFSIDSILRLDVIYIKSVEPLEGKTGAWCMIVVCTLGFVLSLIPSDKSKIKAKVSRSI